MESFGIVVDPVDKAYKKSRFQIFEVFVQKVLINFAVFRYGIQ